MDVYFGSRRLVACDGGVQFHCASVRDDRDGVEHLESWLGARKRRACYRLWVSGAICRPYLVPDLGELPPADTERALMALAVDRTGMAGPLRTWCEPQARGHALRLAAAVQEDVLERIEHCFATAGARLQSVKPSWADALRAAAPLDAKPVALGVRDCDSVTMLAGPGDQFDFAETVSPVTVAGIARVQVSSGVESDQWKFLSLALDDHVDNATAATVVQQSGPKPFPRWIEGVS